MTLSLDLAPSAGHTTPAPTSPEVLSARKALSELLYGQTAIHDPMRSEAQESDGLPLSELPVLDDLGAALIQLAKDLDRKVLLPLANTPREVALVRHGANVLVSEYGTESVPEVGVLDRRVGLTRAIDLCVSTLRAEADALDGARRELRLQLAERLAATPIAEPSVPVDSLDYRGGRSTAPSRKTALAFGYNATLTPGRNLTAARSARADVHATLFPGTLWAFLRGRKVILAKGPIFLAVQRLLVAVRVLVDAWDSGRPANVRLRSGSFTVSVRLSTARRVSLTLGGEGSPPITAEDLDLGEVAAPVLRLANEMARAIVQSDRTQSKNLRVRAFRDEVRTLRRAVRERETVRGFEHTDPERLRSLAGLSSAAPAPATNQGTRRKPRPSAVTRAPGSLRYGERWRIAVDGLDASSAFLCGDRLVLATPRHTVAIGRDRGEVLWLRTGLDVTSFMAGRALVRIDASGRIELCDVEDGEPYATSTIDVRAGTAFERLSIAGAGVPPTLVLTEGPQRVVAIDLRTGQPRWRFSTRSAGPPHFRSVGRVLLIGTPEGMLRALDAASGEELWCFAARERTHTAPVVVGERVYLATGARGARRGELHEIDLLSGRLHRSHPLGGSPMATPSATRDRVAVPVEISGARRLLGFAPDQDEIAWEIDDPGLGSGAAALALDGALICNNPGGRITSIDGRTGATRWSSALADPIADDVPRRLEPVLRGGAIFVPAAAVHALRPHDGSPIGRGLDCDLVPDWLRVDERGWLYVAEESGHLHAYAPVPHLQLIRGG